VNRPMLGSIAVLLACRSLGQVAPNSPAFEVASVKLVPGVPVGLSVNPHHSGGRITWTTTLGFVCTYAYRLPAWRIIGIDKDRSLYEIQATMDASASEDQVRLMLQKLLADRFKMVVHRETKEFQGYALIGAKNGPKIKASTVEESPSLPEYFKGKPPAAFEGRIVVSMEGRGTSAITGRGVSISQLADILGDTLRTFVLDQTGMIGKYYFGFTFLRVGGVIDDVQAPAIFDALQDELGLKLDKQRDPMEVLVVDRLEKPSQN
jgi:uncharacterized protein (TIGR03435 family)